MAKVIAVCKSDKKGVRKEVVDGGVLEKDFGLTGDAHAEKGINRQVSLLAIESINRVEELKLGPGDFAENITTEGLDLVHLPVGTRLLVGNEVVLEISQIGKECHVGCAIFELIGNCIMPQEGVFARVIKGGEVKADDQIEVIAKP